MLGAVQFVNVVDFMMVMPLGPDFAAGLGIPTAKLGLVAGAYTGAAAVAGMIGALFLDRFDRRKALFFAMLGLVLGTAAGGFATGLPSMLLARVAAGAFGGPAASLAMAIVVDVFPPERRGQAIGKVAGSYAVASVVGVPAGLELARLGGWRMPFLVVATLGFVVAMAAIKSMPSLRGHLEKPRMQDAQARRLGALLTDRAVVFSLAAMAALMTGTFALISNLSAFLQFNLGYARAGLGWLYMAGGFVGFFAMRVAGRLIDAKGAVTVASIGTAMSVLGIGLLFLPQRPPVPIVLLFVVIMTSNAMRMVSLNALTSRVPAQQERARYMSMQSAVQHIATSVGALASTALLQQRPDRSLAGMSALAMGTIVLSLMVPVFLLQVAVRIRRREAARVPLTAVP